LENTALGHSSPLLKASRGHPANTRTMNASQGVVAAAMHLQMKAHSLGEEEAAKRVSRELSKAGVKIDHKSIMTWRDKFMRDHRGPGSDFYEKMIAAGAEEDSPKERAANLIRAAVMMSGGTSQAG
jgi:hypothetical protein